ncbi:MAG: hypothetical protein KJ838_01865, partial [Candidatus Omnitrophica bacterium]|nr:hypothetical protein [Candidatus Omnitrophota bacterium]
SRMSLIFDIIKSIRNLRNRINLKANQAVCVSIFPHKKAYYQLIRDNYELIINLGNLSSFKVLEENKRPQDTISDISKNADLYLFFQGLIDVKIEQQKIKEAREKQSKILDGKKARMQNRDFVKKAPRELVEKEKENITELEDTIRRLGQMYNELS